MLIEEYIENLIVFELLVFCYVVMVDEESTKLLTWWKENALRFPIFFLFRLIDF
jgi:hypothetical protein